MYYFCVQIFALEGLALAYHDGTANCVASDIGGNNRILRQALATSNPRGLPGIFWSELHARCTRHTWTSRQLSLSRTPLQTSHRAHRPTVFDWLLPPTPERLGACSRTPWTSRSLPAHRDDEDIACPIQREGHSVPWAPMVHPQQGFRWPIPQHVRKRHQEGRDTKRVHVAWRFVWTKATQVLSAYVAWSSSKGRYRAENRTPPILLLLFECSDPRKTTAHKDCCGVGYKALVTRIVTFSQKGVIQHPASEDEKFRLFDSRYMRNKGVGPSE